MRLNLIMPQTACIFVRLLLQAKKIPEDSVRQEIYRYVLFAVVTKCNLSATRLALRSFSELRAAALRRDKINHPITTFLS